MEEYRKPESDGRIVSTLVGICLAFIGGFCICIATQVLGIVNFVKKTEKQGTPICQCKCDKPDYTCVCPMEEQDAGAEEEKPSQPVAVGQRLTVWGWDWIDVVKDPSGKDEEGDSCGIHKGGYLTVLGILEDNELIVRYISAEEDAPGTGCNSGVVGTILYSMLVRTESDAIKQREKSARIHEVLND